MAKTDYAENLLQAMDIMAKSVAEGLEYDKTIVAKISDNSQSEKGVYTLVYGTTSFQAYTDKTDYDIGDNVYVSIPNGDYTKQKLIVGRYLGNDNSSYYTYSSPWKKFVDVSGDIVDDTEIASSKMSILANGFPDEVDDETKKEVFKFEENGTYKVIWEKNDIEAGDGYTCLGLRVGFKTLLSSLGATVGTYGLQLIVTYRTKTSAGNTDEYRAVKFELNNKDMYGDPYNFETYYNQTKLFDVSGLDTIIGMKLILFQGGNFLTTGNVRVPYEKTITRQLYDTVNQTYTETSQTIPLADNILINDIYIALGYNLDDFDGDEVLLYTPDNKTYNADDNERKQLKVRWIHKDDETGNIICYDGSESFVNVASVHWYKYNQNKGVSDSWAGDFWQEVTDYKDNFTNYLYPDTSKQSDIYKVIIETPLYKNLVNSAAASDATIADLQANLNEAESILESSRSDFASVPSENNYRKYVQAKTNYEAVKATFDVSAASYLTDLQLIESNTLTFTNENPIVDTTTADAVQGLTITCDEDGYKGIYYLYDCTNEMTNKSEAQVKRKLVAEYYSSDDSNILETADTIIWRIPKTNTMIVTPTSGIEFSNTDIISETDDGYYEIKRTSSETGTITLNGYTNITTEQLFRIRDYYSAAATNNTITCIVKKGEVQYSASIELQFGPTGTNGTDYTFLLKMGNGRTCLFKTDGSHYNTIHIVPSLLDYNNLYITDLGNNKITYDWYCQDEDTKVVFCSENGDTKNFKNSDGTYVTSMQSSNEDGSCYIRSLNPNELSSSITDTLPYYYILHAQISQSGVTSSGKSLGTTVLLDAYLPIPYSLNPESYNTIAGGDKIIYAVNGECDYYYKDKYLLYNNNSNKVENITWDLKSAALDNATTETEKKSIAYYIPQITSDGQLIPMSTYINGLDKRISIIAISSDSSRVWIQPILCYKNVYTSTLLNSWDGSLTIDESSGTIMSTMLGAGYKDSQNRYNGVLIGDVKTAADGYAQTGVYGYNEGEQSFGLNIDGTAFFGKSGRGRIELDGNSSTIKNSTYSSNGTGMCIDLDDGYIDILGNSIITKKTNSNGEKVETSFLETCQTLWTKYDKLREEIKTKKESLWSNVKAGYTDTSDIEKTQKQYEEDRQKYENYQLILSAIITGFVPHNAWYDKRLTYYLDQSTNNPIKNLDTQIFNSTYRKTSSMSQDAKKKIPTVYVQIEDNTTYDAIKSNSKLEAYLYELGLNSLSAIFVNDETSDDTEYDYEMTGSEVRISALNPYFSIISGTENHNELLHIGDDSYFLQSDDFTKDELNDDGSINTPGQGFFLDLVNGTLSAHNFDYYSVHNVSVNPEDSIEEQAKEKISAQYNNSSFRLSDSGTPYLQIHYCFTPNEDSLKNDSTLKAVDQDLMYVGYNKFLLQSANWYEKITKDSDGNSLIVPSESSGIQLNFTEGTLKAYDGFSLYAVNKGIENYSSLSKPTENQINLEYHKGSYIYLSSSGNPYFHIYQKYNTGLSYTSLPSEKEIKKMGKYYCKLARQDDNENKIYWSEKSLKPILATTDIINDTTGEIGTIPKGLPSQYLRTNILDISYTNFLLQSFNFGYGWYSLEDVSTTINGTTSTSTVATVRPVGTQIDLLNGTITSFGFNLKAYNEDMTGVIIIDSDAPSNKITNFESYDITPVYVKGSLSDFKDPSEVKPTNISKTKLISEISYTINNNAYYGLGKCYFTEVHSNTKENVSVYLDSCEVDLKYNYVNSKNKILGTGTRTETTYYKKDTASHKYSYVDTTNYKAFSKTFSFNLRSSELTTYGEKFFSLIKITWASTDLSEIDDTGIIAYNFYGIPSDEIKKNYEKITSDGTNFTIVTEVEIIGIKITRGSFGHSGKGQLLVNTDSVANSSYNPITSASANISQCGFAYRTFYDSDGNEVLNYEVGKTNATAYNKVLSKGIGYLEEVFLGTDSTDLSTTSGFTNFQSALEGSYDSNVKITNTLSNDIPIQTALTTENRDNAFRVTWDGRVIADYLSATKGGVIGPFNISNTALYTGTCNSLSGSNGIYLSANGFSINKGSGGITLDSNGDITLSGDIYLNGTIYGESWTLHGYKTTSGGGGGSGGGSGGAATDLHGWTITETSISKGSTILASYGSLTVGSTVLSNGSISLAGSLCIDGAMTLVGTAMIQGNTYITKNLYVNSGTIYAETFSTGSGGSSFTNGSLDLGGNTNFSSGGLYVDANTFLTSSTLQVGSKNVYLSSTSVHISDYVYLTSGVVSIASDYTFSSESGLTLSKTKLTSTGLTLNGGNALTMTGLTVGEGTITKIGALAALDEVVISGTFEYGSGTTLTASGPSIASATAVYTVTLPSDVFEASSGVTAGTYYKDGGDIKVSEKVYYESNSPTASKVTVPVANKSAGTYSLRGSSITLSSPSKVTATLKVEAQAKKKSS